MACHTMLRNSLLFHLCLISFVAGDSRRIIVVGAGPAGIAAASKLFENGFKNVTILEAETRIGGRVHTTKFDNYWVDVGAEEVAGENGNVVFELAWPLGLLERSSIGNQTFIVHDSMGRAISTEISKHFIELYIKYLDEAVNATNGINGSIGDYYLNEFKSHIENNPRLNTSEVPAKQFMALFEKFQNSVDAADSWHDTSARGYSEFTRTCSGDQSINWKERGYDTILQILMKRYPNPEEELPVLNNTLLNTEVATINYNRTDDTVLIKTISGEQYVADHAIVTPSLGVLKEQYETLFVPELPKWKVNAIKGLSFGSVAKIYLSFATPWWPVDSVMGFNFIWNDADKDEIQSDPDKKWLLDLFGFYPVAHKPRLLCGWMSGPGVRYMETLPHDRVLNEATAMLNRFVGKTYNVTKPTGMLRSQWYSNKHFRGTYSYRSMESEKTNVTTDHLARPLMNRDNPVVMFAGEATTSYYYGTVHGAIQSGWREADRIIDLYHKQ